VVPTGIVLNDGAFVVGIGASSWLIVRQRLYQLRPWLHLWLLSAQL
jgi:hypothetical protein